MTLHQTLLVEDLDHFESAQICRTALQNRRILVTGGTGFVGSWLLEAILHLNRSCNLQVQLWILSRNPDRWLQTRPHLATDPTVHIIRGDVLHPEPWIHQIPAVDFVFHGAFDSGLHPGQLTPVHVLSTIVDGTRYVLQAASRAKAKRLLFISSGAVYGNMPHHLSSFPENCLTGPDLLTPGAAYAEGKRVAEAWCAAFCNQHNIQFTAARLFAFAGPYLPLDQHFAFGNFLRDAIAGGPVHIASSGHSIRSYLYGADLALWLIKLLTSERCGSVYNVGSDEAVSIRDLAHLVSDISGCKSPPQFNSDTPNAGSTSVYVPDISLAKSELGLEVRISLQEAIQRTLRYHMRPR